MKPPHPRFKRQLFRYLGFVTAFFVLGSFLDRAADSSAGIYHYFDRLDLYRLTALSSIVTGLGVLIYKLVGRGWKFATVLLFYVLGAATLVDSVLNDPRSTDWATENIFDVIFGGFVLLAVVGFSTWYIYENFKELYEHGEVAHQPDVPPK